MKKKTFTHLMWCFSIAPGVLGIISATVRGDRFDVQVALISGIVTFVFAWIIYGLIRLIFNKSLRQS